MKKSYLFLLLFFTSLIYSQNKLIVVDYGIIIGIDPTYKGSIVEEYYKSAIDNSKYLKFQLKFDSKNSVFNEIKVSKLPNVDLTLAKAFSESSGIFYYSTKDSFYIKVPEQDYENNTAVKYKIDYEWQLKNETKIVGGYLCYKAEGVKKVVNSKGTFKHPVIAWYSPKIPYQFWTNWVLQTSWINFRIANKENCNWCKKNNF
jgi:GLPGLI family protein